jgi:hypothetical protein
LQGVMLVIALSLVLPPPPPPPLVSTPSPDNTRRHPLLPSAPPHPVAAAKPPWSSGHATNTQACPITSAARPTPVRLACGRPSRIIPPPLWSACQTLNPRRLSRHDWPLGSHAKSDARRHRAHTTPGVEGVSCVACPSCACVAAPRPFRMPCQSDRHTYAHDARQYYNPRTAQHRHLLLVVITGSCRTWQLLADGGDHPFPVPGCRCEITS